MNPYLEGFWDDVHTRLVGYIADALGMQLPSGLVACTEERVSVDESFEDGALYRPDVALVESWREGRAAIWSPESESALGGVATWLFVR